MASSVWDWLVREWALERVMENRIYRGLDSRL